MRIQSLLSAHKLTCLIILGVFLLQSFFVYVGFGQESQDCEEADRILKQFPVKSVLEEVRCLVDRIKVDIHSRLKAIIEPVDEDNGLLEQIEELEQFRLMQIGEIEQGELLRDRLPTVLRALKAKEQCLMGAQPASLYVDILKKLAKEKERLEATQTNDVAILCTSLKRIGEKINVIRELYRLTSSILSEDEQRQEIKTKIFNSEELSNWEISEELSNWGSVARHSLRSQPGTYSEDEIEQMVRAKGFRDSDWNPQGDFPNEYEAQTLNGDQVVIDHASGLMWQQGGSEDPMTWSAAQAYVDQLNRNQYAGFSDWRLPTIEELASLLEPTPKNDDCYIDPKFDIRQRWCWSSDKGSSLSAWDVSFTYGNVDWNDMVILHYVRVVHS